MKTPSTDSKRLKRVEDHFTVDPLSSFKDPSILLCNHCGIGKCKIRNYVTRMPKKDAVIKVSKCAMFIPCLGFSVLQGLNDPVWNTIRIGAAWADRLRVGQKVSIIDTKNDKTLETRIVTKVDEGLLSDMIKHHARYNHAIQAEIASNRTRPEDVQDRMSRILKNAYGTNIAAGDRPASVIYLKRP